MPVETSHAKVPRENAAVVESRAAGATAWAGQSARADTGRTGAPKKPSAGKTMATAGTGDVLAGLAGALLAGAGICGHPGVFAAAA